MSSSRTNLTTLPFELQAQIFRHYFKADGGYVFNGDSEKLTTANGNPIDLALMSTCRSIAKHTKDMPLSINTVHFSTVYRRDWMPFAGCFNFVSTFYRLLEEDMLRCRAIHDSRDVLSTCSEVPYICVANSTSVEGNGSI